MSGGPGWHTPGEELLDLEKIQGSRAYENHKIGVGEGWHPIIDTLVDIIDWNVVRGKMPPVVITQIKEKFGTLRFYYGGGDDKTMTLVGFAETLSGRVCEECGKAANTKSRKGWYKTVCDDHI